MKYPQRISFLGVLGLVAMLCLGCEEEDSANTEEYAEYGQGKPDTIPSFADLDLYSPESPFNQRIGASPSLDPASDELVETLIEGGDLLITVKRYSSPVYFADASTPRYDVYIPCGSEWGMGVDYLTDVPIPDEAEPAFDGEPGDDQPYGCAEGPDQDNHMIIFDLDTRCEYDFWQARKTTEGWYASWANCISMDSDGIYPAGMSTRGSGIAFPAGVIWPDELHAGRIEHALAFNHPLTKSGGPILPATDSDGEITRSDAIPEGALFQLNPDLDLSTLGLTEYEMTVAVALQEYGMYLVDNGSSGIGLYAIDPKSVHGNPYSGVLPDEEWPYLPNIPLNEFRLLEMGPQNANYQDELQIVDNACASFE